jgi:hypothetical protein
VINDVIVEGIVVRNPWKFTDHLFFRLGIYRDSDLPPKQSNEVRDIPDYINIHVYGGANGLISIRRGMRLRVHGYIQSRDFFENLDEFVAKARKSNELKNVAVEVKGVDLKPDQIIIDRNAIEIVARRLIVLDGGIVEKKPGLPLPTEGHQPLIPE